MIDDEALSSDTEHDAASYRGVAGTKIGCGVVIGIVIILALIALAIVWFIGANSGSINGGISG